MKGKFAIYSLVAAISIAGSTLFICAEFNVPYTSLIVACTFFFAFFTYSLDHYFDGKNADSSLELHARHQVKDKAYKFALKGIALTGIVSMYFFYLLPQIYLWTGLGIGSLSCLYFILIFKTKVSRVVKQVCSAFILTLVMGGWSLIENLDKVQAVVYLLIVFTAILSNLIVFGYLDAKYDGILADKTEKPLKKRTILVFLYAFAIGIFFIGFVNGVGQTWLFVPLAYALLITGLRKEKLQNDAIRIALDFCVLLPMVKLVFSF
jgi:hypothetical protein